MDSRSPCKFAFPAFFFFFMKAEEGDGQESVLKVKGPKDTGTDGPRPAGPWGELPRVVLNFAC